MKTPVLLWLASTPTLCSGCHVGELKLSSEKQSFRHFGSFPAELHSAGVVCPSCVLPLRHEFTKSLLVSTDRKFETKLSHGITFHFDATCSDFSTHSACTPTTPLPHQPTPTPTDVRDVTCDAPSPRARAKRNFDRKISPASHARYFCQNSCLRWFRSCVRYFCFRLHTTRSFGFIIYCVVCLSLPRFSKSLRQFCENPLLPCSLLHLSRRQIDPLLGFKIYLCLLKIVTLANVKVCRQFCENVQHLCSFVPRHRLKGVRLGTKKIRF